MSLSNVEWIIADANLIGQIYTSATLFGIIFITLFYYIYVEKNIFAKQAEYVFIALFSSVLLDTVFTAIAYNSPTLSFLNHQTKISHYLDLIILFLIHNASMRIWRRSHHKVFIGLGILGVLIGIQVTIQPHFTLPIALYATLCLCLCHYYHILDRAKLTATSLFLITSLFVAINIHYILLYAVTTPIQSFLFQIEWAFILLFIYILVFYVLSNYKVFLDKKDALNSQLIRDTLTGLYSKIYFGELVESTQNGYILFIDVNQFKWINDTLGHSYGDEILRRFGSYLSLLEDQHHVCARYGGDEFAILISNLTLDATKEFATSLCHHFNDNILDIVSEYNVQSTSSLHCPGSVGISIGIAQLTYGNYNAALLQADERMYLAKQKGNYIIQLKYGYKVNV